MIIIERSYDVENSCGGRMRHEITRKVFGDNDITLIQHFLDERSKVPGYEWYNLEFKYTKL